MSYATKINFGFPICKNSGSGLTQTICFVMKGAEIDTAGKLMK